jgi:hypothetical protein
MRPSRRIGFHAFDLIVDDLWTIFLVTPGIATPGYIKSLMQQAGNRVSISPCIPEINSNG